YTGTIEMLYREKPDLLLLGTSLTGKQDGVCIALKVSKICKIPLIFLASQSNAETINRVIRVKPHAYMGIPFNKEELFAAIEIAFSNFTNSHNKAKNKKISLWHAQHFMFVKEGDAYHKLFFKDIVYLESDCNYVTIHLQSQKKVLIRSTLKDFTEQSKQKIFMRVHRSYSVNINKIEAVFPSTITVKGNKIPVGKSYKEDLYSVLGIRKIKKDRRS
ncbi:hypothetical protein LCGC14_2903600, partial [marine sediment metagenome]